MNPGSWLYFFFGECRNGGFSFPLEGSTEGLGDEFLEFEAAGGRSGFDFSEKRIGEINGRSHGWEVCFYASMSS